LRISRHKKGGEQAFAVPLFVRKQEKRDKAFALSLFVSGNDTQVSVPAAPLYIVPDMGEFVNIWWCRKRKTGNRSFDRFPSPHVSQTMFRTRRTFAPRLLTQFCFIRSQPDFGRILSLSASESHNRIVSSAPLDLIIVPQFRIVCQHFFIKK
jgi:hypothetical protein